MSDNTPFRYVFTMRDGETITAAPTEARRVIDTRVPGAKPETVWEIQVRGLWRRFWPEDIVRYLMDEAGQRGSVLIEYALVVSIMGTAAVVALQQLGVSVADVLTTLAGEM